MFNERELHEQKNKLIKNTLKYLADNHRARNVVVEFIKDLGNYDRTHFDIDDARDLFNTLKEKL